MTGQPVLVLASNSPRRSSLLELGGWTFRVRPADIDESQLPGELPENYVRRLAETKSKACARSVRDGEIIIAADTTVTIDGDILGKPRDPADAGTMLRRLRGRKHLVCTGIAVVDTSMDRSATGICITEVPMRDYSDDEIDAYVLTGDPMDKAGAYAIQNGDFRPVTSLTGCFASVMGLPLCHLTRILGQMNVPPTNNVPEKCQSSLGYECTVFPQILAGEDIG